MNYSQYFETKIRPTTQEKFICLNDDAPESLRDLIRSIHNDLFFGALANDWIYEIIEQAFERAEDGENLLDCHISPAVYNSDRANWLEKNFFASEFVNDAFEESALESGKRADIFEIIGKGQVLAIEVIYGAVQNFLESQEDEECANT